MAADFGVYFRAASQPSVESWLAGCANVGYAITIPHSVDLNTTSGTLPAGLNTPAPDMMFEFEVTTGWGGILEVIPEGDGRFACFRCFVREWEVARRNDNQVGVRRQQYHSMRSSNSTTSEFADTVELINIKRL